MSTAWTLVKGAAKYAEAAARGRWRDAADAGRVLDVCRACEKSGRQSADVPGLGRTELLVCGRRLGDEDARAGTCGCLVGLGIGGKPPEPAGKTAIAGERCPSGKW